MNDKKRQKTIRSMAEVAMLLQSKGGITDRHYKNYDNLDPSSLEFQMIFQKAKAALPDINKREYTDAVQSFIDEFRSIASAPKGHTVHVIPSKEGEPIIDDTAIATDDLMCNGTLEFPGPHASGWKQSDVIKESPGEEGTLERSGTNRIAPKLKDFTMTCMLCGKVFGVIKAKTGETVINTEADELDFLVVRYNIDKERENAIRHKVLEIIDTKYDPLSIYNKDKIEKDAESAGISYEQMLIVRAMNKCYEDAGDSENIDRIKETEDAILFYKALNMKKERNRKPRKDTQPRVSKDMSTEDAFDALDDDTPPADIENTDIQTTHSDDSTFDQL